MTPPVHPVVSPPDIIVQMLRSSGGYQTDIDMTFDPSSERNLLVPETQVA